MRFSAWFMVLMMLVFVAACPRRPTCTGCRSGATRCASSTRAETCQEGCWYPTDPVGSGDCRGDMVCCDTTAPYDAGVLQACVKRWECTPPQGSPDGVRSNVGGDVGVEAGGVDASTAMGGDAGGVAETGVDDAAHD